MTSDNSNYAKTWELSLYELNRVPHEIIQDETEIAVSPHSLHNELMCPICLDILKNTMTTKECLHRFCSDCIITALRAGNKECPTCRKKLISKRSLRRDPNFDSLIAKIYPNREEIDSLHEKVLEKLNRKKQQTTLVDSENGGVQQTATTSNGRRRTLNKTNKQISEELSQQSDDAAAAPVNAATASASATTAANQPASRKRVRTVSDNESDLESQLSSAERSHTTQNEYDEVELILKPHPKESTHSSKRFLKTTSNATVSHISKYLSTRLCVENSAASTVSASSSSNSKSSADVQLDFHIYALTTTSSPAQHQLLTANTTLEQIIEKFWKQNKPLELFYTYKIAQQ